MLAGFIGGAATYFFDYIKERNLIVNVEQKEIYDQIIVSNLIVVKTLYLLLIYFCQQDYDIP